MAAGLHLGSLWNLRFTVSVSVSKEAHPKSDIVLRLDIGRSHTDVAVARVVVRVNQVLIDIFPAHGAAGRQIYLYSDLDGAVEFLYHGRLLLALSSKVLNTMVLH